MAKVSQNRLVWLSVFLLIHLSALLSSHFISQDKKNSIVLGNEVFAIDMGTMINNLTDKINISVQNMKYVSKIPMRTTYVVFVHLY